VRQRVYDKTFEVRRNDETHVFDSFECAIHALAPVCEDCGCKVIGHGDVHEERPQAQRQHAGDRIGNDHELSGRHQLRQQLHGQLR